jgi:hypothetical protein
LEDDVRKLLLLASLALAGTGCLPVDSGGGGGGNDSTGGSNYCNTGYCYSYLEGVCCPRSSPYACNGSCYSYSGGGGCTSYKTTCY